MTTLSVVAIRLTRVSIPLTMVHAGSMYVIQKTERTVVELTLENGVTGLGETWGTPDVYTLAQREAVEHVLADPVLREASREPVSLRRAPGLAQPGRAVLERELDHGALGLLDHVHRARVHHGERDRHAGQAYRADA